MIRTACALLLLCLSTHAWADSKRLERFYGYAYDLESGEYLYTEVHAQIIDTDHWYSGTIDYFAPDGMKIAHKTLSFNNSASIPVFRFEDFRSGYIEGIGAVGKDSISLFKRSQHESRMQNETVERSDPMAGDSGFHMLIYNNFESLMQGDMLSFRLAVPGRLTAYQFRIRKTGDEPLNGKPAVQLIVEPDSLLRWLVDPLNLTYDPKTRKLLEYRGISNLPNPATHKNYVARIIYPDHKPEGAPAKLPPLK